MLHKVPHPHPSHTPPFDAEGFGNVLSGRQQAFGTRHGPSIATVHAHPQIIGHQANCIRARTGVSAETAESVLNGRTQVHDDHDRIKLEHIVDRTPKTKTIKIVDRLPNRGNPFRHVNTMNGDDAGYGRTGRQSL